MEKLKSGPLEGLLYSILLGYWQVHLQPEHLRTWGPTSLRWSAIVTEQMKDIFRLSWKQKKV